MLSITPTTEGFGWHVSFTNDPRLPRSGTSSTFLKALSDVVETILREINDATPIPTIDRRPETS